MAIKTTKQPDSNTTSTKQIDPNKMLFNPNRILIPFPYRRNWTPSQQKEKYDVYNYLFSNAFYDVLKNGKVSALRRLAIENVPDENYRPYFIKVFDMLDKYSATNHDLLKRNLTDFCIFFFETKVGKELYEMFFRNEKMPNYEFLLNLFTDKRFIFADSKLLEQLTLMVKNEYVKDSYK